MSSKIFIRFLCAILFCGALSLAAFAQQTPPQPKPTPTQRPDEALQGDDVVRVESELTNVLFTAVDKNRRFITTLKREDIRVLEDGVPQDIFTFQRETDRPLSLAILLDVSASQEYTLPDQKSAAQQFVDAVIRPQKDEVAVISFTGDATVEQGLTGSVARIRSAIDRVRFVPPAGYIGNGQVMGTPPVVDSNQGTTAIWDAIWATSEEILSTSSDKTRRAIILLTDGEDTSSRLRINDAIDRALKADAVIYSIGIGDYVHYTGINRSVLTKISERTGGRAFFPRSDADLRAAFDQIQQELRSQYLVAYSPKNKAHDGSYRTLKIEIVNPDLKKQNLKLTYRQGYFAKKAATSGK
jgi:Ca-activated chloride channel family protein